MKTLSKKILLFAFGILSICTAKAQLDVKSDFIGFLYNNVSLAAEVTTGYQTSVQLGAHFWNRANSDRSTLWINSEVRFYFLESEGATGLFVGPYLGYRRYTDPTWNRNNEVLGPGYWIGLEETTLNLGLVSGYKLVSEVGFFVEFSGALGRSIFKKSDYTEEVAGLTDGGDSFSIDARLGLFVGWSFNLGNAKEKNTK